MQTEIVISKLLNRVLLSLGLITIALTISVSEALAIPSPGTDADATAKWESLVIPSLPVSDPSLAQQVAIIPVFAPDDHSIATGTGVQGGSGGGAIVRGFTEVGFAAPGTHGGGSLEATSYAHTVTVYQAVGTGPIDVDVDVHISGSLEGGNFFSGSPGNLTSEAIFDAILHTSSGSVSLFSGEALFDIVAGGTNSTLSLLGDWTPGDFSSFVPGGFFTQGRSVNLNDLNENAAVVNPGDQFAIELILDTSVYAVGAFEAVARANFDSTGGFALSSDTPDASFVVVPEPASMVLAAIGIVGLFYFNRRQT